MNIFLVFALVASLVGVPATINDCAPKTDGPASKTSSRQESPFACNRTALSAEARKRHFEELGPQMRGMIKRVHELPDGYEFEFSADPRTVQLVAEWAAGERLCCPFFDITMRLAPENGPLWLSLTGREGTKKFIEVDAAAWLNNKK